MLDWRVALPPRVAAAVRRCRPRLGATLLRGPWGGWTWLTAPAVVVAAHGAPGASSALLLAVGLAAVLGVHAATWLRWRSTAAQDPRVPVLLGLERTRARFNALAPRLQVRATERAAGLRKTDPVVDQAQATRRGIDCLAHALGRALSQQPPIGQGRSGWAGSRGGLADHAEDLKRLAGRVAQLETSLAGDVLIDPPPEHSTVLPFPRRS